MNIPPKLPISADQSRAARFQLGKTQADVIQESGLPGYKLKQFETGRFVPDMKFLESLRDYYAAKGLEFAEAEAESKQVAGKSVAGSKKAAGGVGTMVRPFERMHFCVSDSVSREVLEQALERMDKNDESIAEFFELPVKSGLFREFSEETEDQLRDLYGYMAENYLIFRFLQGRSLVSAPPEGVAPATLADVVAKLFAGSPLANIASGIIEGAAKRVPDADETESEGGEA